MLHTIIEQNKLDCIVLLNAEEIYAYCGYNFSSANCNAAILFKEKRYFIVPEGNVPGEIKCNDNFCTYVEYGFYECPDAVKSFTKLIMNILPHKGRVGYSSSFAKMPLFVNDRTITWVDISNEIIKGMLCKPQNVIEYFKLNSKINSNAYENIRKNFKIGITELELRQLVEESYNTSTGAVIKSGGDFLSGERTTLISGEPTNKVIEEGDSIIVDIQATWNGVGVDDCRTFFAGKPNKEKEDVYNAVLQAIKEGELALQPNTPCNYIYEKVNKSIIKSGYKELPHHAGHGLGYYWYEAPYFIPQNEEIIKEGMLVTLEPGIYTENFGVRIENNYLITKNGFEKITATPQDFLWSVLN